MTTNQTIDGVPRGLLEQFLAGGRQCDREALRALLDAPAPESDTEQWFADTPDGDSALVTRVAALCRHPSMSFHQVALLEGAISESKPAAQPQGEPVACFEKFARDRCPGVYFGKDANGEYMAADARLVLDFWNAGRRAEQPAPVAVVLPERKT